MADINESEKIHEQRVEGKTEQVSSSSGSDQNVATVPENDPAEKVSASTIMAIFVSGRPP